jgi:predicted CopG family antitoxin
MKNLKHITVNEEVYQKLKNLGKAGDSFNDVLTKSLEKKLLLLESDSRVGTRDTQTLTRTNNTPSVKRSI